MTLLILFLNFLVLSLKVFPQHFWFLFFFFEDFSISTMYNCREILRISLQFVQEMPVALIILTLIFSIFFSVLLVTKLLSL
jgi:hypothetical protein